MKTPNDNEGGPRPLDVDVGLIDFDPKNRKEHDKAALESLRDSIKAEGLLEPLVVRFHPQKSGRYMLIAGERRLRALQMLKANQAPVRLIADKDDAGAARKRLVENMQREDLTPIEEARGYRELCVDHKMTQAEVAKLAGVGQPTVANSLRLLELPAEVQQLVQDGQLTRAHGVALARFARWPKICKRLGELVIKKGASSKQIEQSTLLFSYELVKDGLVVEIENRPWSGTSYKVPAAMQKDPDFIKQGWGDDWYCLAPEKWAPEKARQDKAAAEALKAAKKKDAAAVAQGGKTKEQLERAQLIKKNKAARDKIANTTAAMRLRLGATKALDNLAVAYAAHHTARNVSTTTTKQAAASLGIKLPAKFNPWQREHWLDLKPVDAIRLAAAAHASSEGERVAKWAGAVPEEVKFLLGKGGAK